jgi:hypothetical protein
MTTLQWSKIEADDGITSTSELSSSITEPGSSVSDTNESSTGENTAHSEEKQDSSVQQQSNTKLTTKIQSLPSTLPLKHQSTHLGTSHGELLLHAGRGRPRVDSMPPLRMEKLRQSQTVIAPTKKPQLSTNSNNKSTNGTTVEGNMEKMDYSTFKFLVTQFQHISITLTELSDRLNTIEKQQKSLLASQLKEPMGCAAAPPAIVVISQEALTEYFGSTNDG